MYNTFMRRHLVNVAAFLLFIALVILAQAPDGAIWLLEDGKGEPGRLFLCSNAQARF